MKLIMLGPPGSGKGTVAEKLAREFKLLSISPGKLLRSEVARKTVIGKQIKPTVERGDLVEHNIVNQLVRKKIGRKKQFILDGFPRCLEQARGIEDLKIDKVIYLDVPEKVVIERLAGRRMDPRTGKIYHLMYLPPPKSIVKRLVRRKDDRPKAIKERFKVFRKDTLAVIKYYQKKVMLRRVDGSLPPEKVYEIVKKYVVSRKWQKNEFISCTLLLEMSAK